MTDFASAVTISSPYLRRAQALHSLVITNGLPTLGLIAAIALAVRDGFRPIDAAMLFVTYTFTSFGVELGLHRYFTHRSFQTRPAIVAALAILGSACGQGQLAYWVANHRIHHRYAEGPGDPHSPYAPEGPRELGWRGFLWAHVGWTFSADPPNTAKFAGDILRDPLLRFINRRYFLWLFLGIAVPTAVGFAITGDLRGMLSGLLWGGLARMFLVNHASFSINSICHAFGRRRFETRDESRNVGLLALPTAGASWHNDHHAFPSAADFRFSRLQFDPSGIAVSVLEKLALAWNVNRPSAADRERREVQSEVS